MNCMIQKKHVVVVLVGVVIGLLIAPYKGVKTRKKVSRALDDLSDYIHNNFIDNQNENELEELVDLQIESYASM